MVGGWAGEAIPRVWIVMWNQEVAREREKFLLLGVPSAAGTRGPNVPSPPREGEPGVRGVSYGPSILTFLLTTDVFWHGNWENRDKQEKLK